MLKQKGLEDAWFDFLFQKQDAAKAFSLLLLITVLPSLWFLTRKMNLWDASYIVLSAFLLSNYVYSPQMTLWLLPFIAISPSLPPQYFILDASNSAIILTWFTATKPLNPLSPPQIFAKIRAIALVLSLIEIQITREGPIICYGKKK